MALSIESRQLGGITVVKCAGRIVEGEASASLHRRLDELIADDPCVIVHLGGVDFIDSGGVGLLVRALNRARRANGDLKLCAVPARITEVLRITRLHGVFESHDSEAEAVAAFYQGGTTAAATGRLESEILCVEPSGDLLAYLCEMLRQAGYGVMASDNLPDALVLFRACRPKVVVIGESLGTARDTYTARTFNELAAAGAIVELPADFSSRDAAEAASRLLDQIQKAIGKNVTNLRM